MRWLLVGCVVLGACGKKAPAAAVPEATEQVTVTAGRACQDTPAGQPDTASAMLAALEQGGVTVLASEEMVVCSACDCPKASVMVTVSAADAARVAELSEGWVPPKEDNGLKSSLP